MSTLDNKPMTVPSAFDQKPEKERRTWKPSLISAWKPLIVIGVVLSLLLLPLPQSQSVSAQEVEQEESAAQSGETTAAESEEEQVTAVPSQTEIEIDWQEPPRPEEAWPDLNLISARAYLVVNSDTGETLLELNPDDEAYPASMTKIMTALVVLEHPEYDPLRLIHFSEVACAMPAAESATAGFLPGEQCTTIACLYAMMTRSANEVANALAENYGGTIEGFVALMNQKAEELGCEHTNFVDPCGFGYVDHHTTARDLVKIITQAMKHRVFQKLVTTKIYSVPPTNLHPISGWSNLFNSNYLMTFQDAGYRSPWLASIDGVKTGTTDLAGQCLASAATTTNGKHLISVIFDAVYTGAYENSYVGPSIMSRTLLTEGAKLVNAPPISDPKALDVQAYGWPTLAEKVPEPTEIKVSDQPSETQPLLLPTFEGGGEIKAPVAEGEIAVRKWQLILLILAVSLLLLLTCLLISRQKSLKRKIRYYRSRPLSSPPERSPVVRKRYRDR